MISLYVLHCFEEIEKCMCICHRYMTMIWLIHTLKFRAIYPLRWRHNEWDGVLNHKPHHCLLNRLSGRRSKKTSMPRVTGLCAGNSPGTGEFPAQMAGNAETDSIWCLTGLCTGIHRWLVNSPYKRPVTRKMFPFDDVIKCISHLFPTLRWDSQVKCFRS